MSSADTCCNTDDVILSSNIINLDKNCIKYREKSYKKFLTRPLSVPSNLNLTKRLTMVLRQTSHDEEQVVKPSSMTPSGPAANPHIDLDIIKRLEEEIYKKREMVYLNYDANKAAGSKQQPLLSSSSQTVRNICPHITTTKAHQKPVLYLDAEKFEPILLRNDHIVADKNHSVVIIDNSQYYPILMRCDDNNQRHLPQPRAKNTETVDTENGPTSSSTSIKFKRFLFNRNSFSFRFKNKRRRKQQQQDDHEVEAPLVMLRSSSDNSIAHAPHWGNEGNSIVKRIPVYQAFSEPDLNEETATTTTTLTATSSSTATSTSSQQRRGHLQQNRYDLILKNPNNNSTQICFVKNSAPKKRNTTNKYATKNANNVMLRHSAGPSTSAVKTWIYRRR